MKISLVTLALALATLPAVAQTPSPTPQTIVVADKTYEDAIVTKVTKDGVTLAYTPVGKSKGSGNAFLRIKEMPEEMQKQYANAIASKITEDIQLQFDNSHRDRSTPHADGPNNQDRNYVADHKPTLSDYEREEMRKIAIVVYGWKGLQSFYNTLIAQCSSLSEPIAIYGTGATAGTTVEYDLGGPMWLYPVGEYQYLDENLKPKTVKSYALSMEEGWQRKQWAKKVSQ